MSKVRVKIIQPTRTVLNTECEHVIIPGSAGDFGVYPEHTPLITTIRPGILIIFDNGVKDTYAIHDGFVTVEENVVRIVCEVIEKSDEIDIARAENSAQRARERLRKQEENIDYRRAEAALSRSISRINAVKDLK